MKRKPFDLIPGLLQTYGIDTKRLGEIIGKRDPETVRGRLRNPETFQLRELRAINRAGVPADALRECIKF